MKDYKVKLLPVISWVIILLALAVLVVGCAQIDDVSHVQGIIPRAISTNLSAGGIQGGLTADGFAMSDAALVTYYYDKTEEALKMAAAHNKGTMTASLTQLAISLSIAALAIGRAPILPAGILAGSSIGVERYANLINDPSKAQAHLDYAMANSAAFDKYLADLMIETCGTKVRGDTMTNAGVSFQEAMGANDRLRTAALQRSRPTLEDVKAVQVESGQMMVMRDARSLCNQDVGVQERMLRAKPPLQQLDQFKQFQQFQQLQELQQQRQLQMKRELEAPQSKLELHGEMVKPKVTTKSMNKESLSRFPKEP